MIRGIVHTRSVIEPRVLTSPLTETVNPTDVGSYESRVTMYGPIGQNASAFLHMVI